MKVADVRVIEFAAYMKTNSPGTPGFNPHEGYDATAYRFGYNLIGENLAWLSMDPARIVYAIWQTPLHLAAMVARDANVAGVSCLISEGTPYWTYNPGYHEHAEFRF